MNNSVHPSLTGILCIIAKKNFKAFETWIKEDSEGEILTFIPTLLPSLLPMSNWSPPEYNVETEKERLISDYKNNTGYGCSILVVYDCSLYYRAKPCRHFQQGNGVCPFGNVCHGELRTVLFLVLKKSTTITHFDQ